MRVLAFSALLLCNLALSALAGSSWGDGSGDLVPGDHAKPMVVDPWPGAHHDDVIKLDDPIIIIDIGPSEEDEGIIFIGEPGSFLLMNPARPQNWIVR